MVYHLFRNGIGALCAFMLLAGAAPDARAQSAGTEALRTAFAEGDAQALLAHATERVEVDLPEGGSQYSQSQAVYVMQEFFETHPPRRFAWQRTATQVQSRMLAGRYWHGASKQPMTVFLRLSKSQGEWRLQEIRIREP